MTWLPEALGPARVCYAGDLHKDASGLQHGLPLGSPD